MAIIIQNTFQSSKLWHIEIAKSLGIYLINYQKIEENAFKMSDPRQQGTSICYPI